MSQDSGGAHDPREEDRSLIDAHLQVLAEGSGVDAYERAALESAWEGVTGERFRMLGPRIRVELTSVRDLDAMRAGTVAKAVQEATAILGAHLNHRTEVHQIRSGDIERVHMVQEAQRGNVIWLRIQDEDDHLPLPSLWPAERAVRELLSYLPRDVADRGAVEGALGALQPVRRAVDTIAGLSLANHSEIGLALYADDSEPTTSVLTHDTAGYLHESLDTGREVVESETRRARVDGMRNSRRVCYLVLSGHRELAVSISDDQRPIVQSLIGRMVTAELSSRRVESPAGRRTHKAYRLISLRDDDAQLPT